MGQKEYYERYFDQFSARSDDRTRERILLLRDELAGQSGRLLQVSCGNGLETKLLAELGDFDITAVDISERALEAARQYGASTIQLDIETRNVEGLYDFITCFELLEHLVNPKEVLERLRSNLRQGGRLLISVPNEFHLIRRLQFLVGVFEFAHYDWHHLRFFTHSETDRIVRDSGYKTIRKTFTGLWPPRVRFLSTLSRCLAEVLPNLFAFSFVLVLTHGQKGYDRSD